jgi:hypothetical protein
MSLDHISCGDTVYCLYERSNIVITFTNTSAELHFSFILDAPNVNGCQIIRKVSVILNVQSAAELMSLIVHNHY